MTKQEFQALTNKGVVLLDGATGSNLRKAGMPVGISSEQWVLENPQVLQNLQRAYVDAGSQIVYAPTFAANRISMRNFNLVMATAADLVIAEADEVVDMIDPNYVETPGVYVKYYVDGGKE